LAICGINVEGYRGRYTSIQDTLIPIEKNWDRYTSPKKEFIHIKSQF